MDIMNHHKPSSFSGDQETSAREKTTKVRLHTVVSSFFSACSKWLISRLGTGGPCSVLFDLTFSVGAVLVELHGWTPSGFNSRKRPKSNWYLETSAFGWVFLTNLSHSNARLSTFGIEVQETKKHLLKKKKWCSGSLKKKKETPSLTKDKGWISIAALPLSLLVKELNQPRLLETNSPKLKIYMYICWSLLVDHILYVSNRLLILHYVVHISGGFFLKPSLFRYHSAKKWKTCLATWS